MLKKAFFIALLASVSCRSLGQENPVFRTESQIVIIPTVVRDANGQAVYGLEAKDFVVRDDDVEQPVQVDERSDIEPVSIVVAVQSGRRQRSACWSPSAQRALARIE